MPSIEVLTEKGLTVRLEKGRLAVSPKTKITDSLRLFITEQKESLIQELQTETLNKLFTQNPDLQEQFEFEIEERTAIMIFDGKLSEENAKQLAKETTTDIWLKIFIGSI